MDSTNNDSTTQDERQPPGITVNEPAPVKRRGRPKGSKNKPKIPAVVPPEAPVEMDAAAVDAPVPETRAEGAETSMAVAANESDQLPALEEGMLRTPAPAAGSTSAMMARPPKPRRGRREGSSAKLAADIDLVAAALRRLEELEGDDLVIRLQVASQDKRRIIEGILAL